MYDSNDDPHSSYGNIMELILIGLATISSLISLLIPALYHIKRQCRQHPTNLISKISLLEALSNYNVILIAVNIYKFEQYIDITNIFDVITFNQPEEPTETQFCQVNYILYMILELSSIAYNISFSVDLLVTLKFPFYAGMRSLIFTLGKKRMKFYNIFAFVFLLATMPEAIIEAYGNISFFISDICQNQFHNRSIYKVPVIFIIVLAIFYGISFYIIIYSILQIKKIGKVRAQYIRHHRFILIILLSAWLFPLWTNILIYLGDQSSDQFYVVNLLSFITLILLGAIVNIVRFYHDRFLWEKVKKMIKCSPQRKRNKIKQQNNQEQLDIWNVPLATAVAQLNNQKVIHSIIQVVSFACSECQIQKLMQMKRDPQKRTRSIATLTQKQKDILQKLQYQSSIHNNRNQLEQKFIERDIQNALLPDLKKICKRNKKFNMYCLHDNQNQPHSQVHKTLREKTLFTKERDGLTKTQPGQQKRRATRDLRNHQSLVNDKDLNKIRSQILANNTSQITAGSNIANMKKNPMQNENKQQDIEIKVVSYAHKIFSSIRKLYRLGQEQIQQSLDLQNNVQNILKAKQSLGASGSFFFFSYDHKLIIKTIGQGQDKVLLNILPEYYLHLKKYKDSLLTKIFGLFSVEIAGISKITFILLQNSFQRMQKQNIQFKRYDLKGSTVQRQVKDPKAQVLKDINYLKSADAFIMMSPQQRQRLIRQIQVDIILLRNQNVMDYSLLLGVGVRAKAKSDIGWENEQQSRILQQNQQRLIDQMNFQRDVLRRKRESGLNFNKAPLHNSKKVFLPKNYEKSWKYLDQYQDISGRIYSISIIDYLQQFNFNKYMELQLKKIFKGGGDISSVDSEFYFERFMNFVRKILIPIKNLKLKNNQKKKKTSDINDDSAQKQKTKTIFQVKIHEQWEDVFLKQE